MQRVSLSARAMNRLLHCIPSLGAGGAERQLTMLTHQLPHHGWEVHIAVLKGGVFETQLAPSTVVHHVPHHGSRDLRIPFRLAALIGRIRPLIVQTWLTNMDIFAGAAALTRSVPWIATERSSALAYPPRLENRLRAFLLPHADAIVANSRGGLDVWQRSASRQIQRIIPNGISALTDDGTPLPAWMPASSDAPIVVFVGRLSEEKRLPTLLRAMAEVRRQIPAITVLCGTGRMHAELQATARALSLEDSVIFAGHVSDVPSIVRRADVFVSISRFEGFPNAVQEAMVCGTPLVVSDIPSHREFLDEAAARLVDGDDVPKIADAIIDCLSLRDAARNRAAEALRRTAAWSSQAMAGEYDALYRQILSLHGTSRVAEVTD
jgi:glycosyltransferase involved in cell wall biosynthesis